MTKLDEEFLSYIISCPADKFSVECAKDFIRRGANVNAGAVSCASDTLLGEFLFSCSCHDRKAEIFDLFCESGFYLHVYNIQEILSSCFLGGGGVDVAVRLAQYHELFAVHDIISEWKERFYVNFGFGYEDVDYSYDSEMNFVSSIIRIMQNKYREIIATQRGVIVQKLRQVETKYDIVILLAVESGSRAWGFDSPDSDYDVRFIYVHDKNHYLSIEKRRDVIELPIDGVYDINGWDLRKALELFRKSNPVLLEWLNSPTVYIKEKILFDELQRMKSEYFDNKACIHHYLNMARGNWREYLRGETVKLKKYLYVLRPLLACNWMELHDTPPPMEFSKLLELVTDPDLLVAINNLLTMKKAGSELGESKPVEIINNYLATEIARLGAVCEQISQSRRKAPEYRELNNLFRKIVMQFS